MNFETNKISIIIGNIEFIIIANIVSFFLLSFLINDIIPNINPITFITKKIPITVAESL